MPAALSIIQAVLPLVSQLLQLLQAQGHPATPAVAEALSHLHLAAADVHADHAEEHADV